MKIQQIRNATVLLDFGDQKILVDPMLARKNSIPSLKWITSSRRRNPLVDLPIGTEEVLRTVTHVLITHCQKGHFDHLDRAAVKWIRQKNLPVLCSKEDEAYLLKLGFNVEALIPDRENKVFQGTIRPIPCRHGQGFIGSLMAHGNGYIISLPGEPSVYVIGDSILTPEIEKGIEQHRPDVVIMPGGGARFDFGGDIIMGLEDVVPMSQIVRGPLIINHLEALDHCPVTREEIIELCRKNEMRNVIVPRDGEVVSF